MIERLTFRWSGCASERGVVRNHLMLKLLAIAVALAFVAACKSGDGRRVEPRAADGEVVARASRGDANAAELQPPDDAMRTRARAVTALAAVFEAAAQAADPATHERLRGFGVAPAPNAAVDAAFPERRALAEAVAAWPAPRKEAALAWVGENLTWTSQLHALVLESFDADFQPLDHGPTLSRYAPAIFGNRAALAPLLHDALADAAIAQIAERVAAQPEPFTPAGIAAHREKLVAYLRLTDDLPRFGALFTPLLAPGNGVNARLSDGTVLMVVGPRATPSERSMVLFHEMAHQPLIRVTERPAVAAALHASACALDRIEARYGYEQWRWYFSEVLVRSLSYRLVGVPARDTGFVFEAELVAQLERWEASPDVPFEDAVVAMLGGIRERYCGAEGPIEAALPCPAPQVRLASGSCLLLPAETNPDLPVAIYLHGMTTRPDTVLAEGRRLADASAGAFAVLVPLGRRGVCSWSDEARRHYCWPTRPESQPAVDALAAQFRADLAEAAERLGSGAARAPVLVGFSNGAFAASALAASTDLDLAGLVVLHGGASYTIGAPRAVPTLLRAATGDTWHHPTMRELRASLIAAGWRAAWQERDGEHAFLESDAAAVARFVAGSRPHAESL